MNAKWQKRSKTSRWRDYTWSKGSGRREVKGRKETERLWNRLKEKEEEKLWNFKSAQWECQENVSE